MKDAGPNERTWTMPLTADGRHALLAQFRLRVLEGSDQGREFVSKGSHTRIGTHETVDVLLEDRTVSRFHCEISSIEDQVMVKDTDSTNGTKLDGVAIYSAPLRQIGRASCRERV